MMNQETIDILHVSDKLVIARLPRIIWSIFSSFLIFCCYFTHLKACEIRSQVGKISELEKYCPYCTQNRAITNAYIHKR